MLKEREKFFRYLFISIDFVFVIFSFQFGIILRRILPWGGPFLGYEVTYYILISIIAGFTQVWILRSAKFYHTRRGEKFPREIWEVIQGIFINFLLLIAILFFFRDFSYSRLVFAYSFISNIIILTVVHGLLRAIFSKMRAKGRNLRHIIILGQHHLGLQLAEKILKAPEMGYRIYGIVPEDAKGKEIKGLATNDIKNIRKSLITQSGKGPKKDSKKISEASKLPNLSWKQFKEALQNWHIDAVILAIPGHREDLFFEVAALCQVENIDIRVIPVEIGLMGLPWNIENFFDFPVINFGKTPLDSVGAQNTKRAFDIIFSLIIILVSLPLFFFITALIRSTSRGSVFFQQERMGLDNKIFKMLKFRTMKVQSKDVSDTTWTTNDDPRKTRFGNFLRKTNLDELPQFINVFLGQMSVVGPRPERPHFVKKFKKDIPEYMLRHKVKAGITGWAQINGFRGDTSIKKRVDADLWYIENWTLGLDLKIVILTLFRGFFDKNAY